MWLTGVGAFGSGWGIVGQGVSVRAGAALYIKYSSGGGTAPALQIAPHGSDDWEPFGPKRDANSASKPNGTVILKIEKLGTPQSTATWINGPSTIAAGIISSGAYDLRLGPQATWTLPPITVSPKTTWWDAFFHAPTLASTPADPINASVPDRGTTLMLLTLGLAGALLCWRLVRHRHQRTR